MTRRRVILLVLALLLAAGTVAYLCIPSEPRYEGRSLSSWIDTGLNSYRSVPGSEEWQAANNAVVQIGTNGIPWLLKWASTKDSKTQSTTISWINSCLPLHFHFSSDRQRKARAILGFKCLGPAAGPAWPIFIQWTLDKHDPARRRLGLECLAATKPDHETILPVLHRMFDDPDKDVRVCATSIFIRFASTPPNEKSSLGFLAAKNSFNSPFRSCPFVFIRG